MENGFKVNYCNFQVGDEFILAIKTISFSPVASVTDFFCNGKTFLLFLYFPDDATNLFLKENGHEILKAMTPQLQKKLSSEFTGIANTLLKNVPRNYFIVD